MKILIISHKFFPDIGGIESISEMLAYQFWKAGHEVHIMTWSKDKNEKKFPFTVTRSPNILKLFREHKWTDLIFENNPCIRLAWPCIFFGKLHIIGLQTWIARTNGKVSLIDQFKLKWLKHAKTVIACSEAIRKRCWPAAIVIGNPYEEKNFKKLYHVIRNKEFVFAGRLVPDKGADLAIKAFNKLRLWQKSPSYSMTIIGDGPEKKVLENLVNTLQLQKQIKFAGTLREKEMAECLNEHKFLLVTSVWEEPFGIIALEGMACGCLPIVSDGGGLPDAIGKAGLTFRRGDMNDLVRSIEDILNNPDKENQVRSRIKHHLMAHTSKEVARKYLEVIESYFYNTVLN